MAASALHPRFVTAASLFDGHDASINIMRRVLQAQGAEVIHLGHNRSVAEVVQAVIQEDANGVAISSYQGGHVEYFTYLVELLREKGMGHVKVFGGGGGVIVPAEIELLHERGVTRIFSPADGQEMGLVGMIKYMIDEVNTDVDASTFDEDAIRSGDFAALSRAITLAEAGQLPQSVRDTTGAPVLGITGTGGSGKSSLTDELVRRFRLDYEDKLSIAVIAVDPTKRKGGGALLGDRIRMNALGEGRVFFRSLATRGADQQLPESLHDVVALTRMSGADVIIVETPGIGQGDAAIIPYVDTSLYVMTPEFGAASQLEKIDMLDFADFVAVNKFERRGAADAVRDVARQLIRNREAFGSTPDEMPVFGTSAATFNDDGVTALYGALRDGLCGSGLAAPSGGMLDIPSTKTSTRIATLIPPRRVGYLGDIAGCIRDYHEATEADAKAVEKAAAYRATADALPDETSVAELASQAEEAVSEGARKSLSVWDDTVAAYSGDEYVFSVRGKEIRTPLKKTSLSGSNISRVALPTATSQADILRFLRRENLPGHFPFTAGVFPFKRDGEDPARMFAGEGDPFRTNRRFHYLSKDSDAARLSTAFDSVTLYGRDPGTSPDVYGKVGTSGVSIATLDDMKALYDGFDLCAPTTSVSMTINGPAPTMLAFFLNTAIDQQIGAFEEEAGRPATDEEREQCRARALSSVRGTVQADILKEDQGQNTCIFSTEFSLRMMGDIAQYFVDNSVRNFYSVSISGYHIAEAGANPISQLAFTLANGFTYVESYLARGMDINDFAPNLSFFFSNGMDIEYTVIGRVARRIWAVAMKERYGANERSQKLKYHIQTSGRSLHAQEMEFNDIRTTLQALCALYDNANSLHTNAYDEAITTPTESSVRRALAIQLIINREWGLAMNENPLQGSYILDELTDLVEEAVLAEFEAMSERGGVLGAMETGYQRGRIQDESMIYEHRKHDGTLPIIGVNTFLPPEGSDTDVEIELARGTDEEKKSQLERLQGFQTRHADVSGEALRRLQAAAMSDENVFAVLMDVSRVCSLGQVTEALFEVGGQYRRNV